MHAWILMSALIALASISRNWFLARWHCPCEELCTELRDRDGVGHPGLHDRLSEGLPHSALKGAAIPATRQAIPAFG